MQDVSVEPAVDRRLTKSTPALGHQSTGEWHLNALQARIDWHGWGAAVASMNTDYRDIVDLAERVYEPDD